MKARPVILLSILLWLVLRAAAAQQVLMIGAFSTGDLKDWQRQSFAGETVYQLVEMEDRRVLRAYSQGSASGLYRKIKVDLEKTPYLNWSWRVEEVLKGLNELSKAGDDYPARVYALVSGGALFWKTRTLVYVWSSHQPPGSHWPSAYTANAQVLALRSGNAMAGQWVGEKRDVRADFKRVFGEDIRSIDAIAIMTDTDNSGQAAKAWYGDIFFSAQ